MIIFHKTNLKEGGEKEIKLNRYSQALEEFSAAERK